jgi:hypothetical protein
VGEWDDPARRAEEGVDSPAFESWALIELMGHRRVVAKVSEQTIAGHGFIRLDEPAVDGHEPRTQLVAPGAIYAMHPMTEELAMLYAAKWRSAPLTQWDLPEQWREALAEHRKAATTKELERSVEAAENTWTVVPDLDDGEND